MFIYASHPRCEWLKLVLGMVGLAGSQIWWTWEVEDTFRQVTTRPASLPETHPHTRPAAPLAPHPPWSYVAMCAMCQVLAGNKYAMKTLEGKLTGQLNDLVAMVRAPLDKITRKKVNTLLIIDVHARDIVDGFVRESILNAKEFAWYVWPRWKHHPCPSRHTNNPLHPVATAAHRDV